MAFEGKITVVTGSAGGLGIHIVRAFLNQGSKVVMVDINHDRLETAVSSLEILRHNVLPLAADITVEDNVRTIFRTAYEKFGAVDILVNNAGLMDRFDPVGSCDLELWNRVIAVNLTAPMLLSKHAIDQFLNQDRPDGVILNVGSVGGERGGRAGAAYTASKHGIIGLTKNTAAFYSKKGIRCNAVLPGSMVTNIKDAMAQGFNIEAFEQMKLTMAMDPGTVDLDKAAETIVFLCSESAKRVTGACVEIDRGWTAW